MILPYPLESGCHIAGLANRSFSPRRRQRYELHLHGFSLPEKSGVPLASRKKRIAQVAGRHDGEAQCRYGRESDARGEASYSITGITWVYLPASGLSSERGHALKEFLAWVLEAGQKMAPLLGYTSLPASLASKAREKLGMVQ